MYRLYFYSLHTITNTKSSLLYQSILFETLLKQTDASLFYYLVSIGAPPLQIAYRWIVYAFVGVLDVEQVLHLWDRMIAFDTCDILAVAAASIFRFRRKHLVTARSLADVNVN